MRARISPTRDLVLIIAKEAVEIRREYIRQYCAKLGDWSRNRFDYCQNPETINYFNKREFIKAYYRLRNRLGIKAKWETLLRTLRKMAQENDRIAYASRNGVYKLLDGGAER